MVHCFLYLHEVQDCLALTFVVICAKPRVFCPFMTEVFENVVSIELNSWEDNA